MSARTWETTPPFLRAVAVTIGLRSQSVRKDSHSYRNDSRFGRSGRGGSWQFSMRNLGNQGHRSVCPDSARRWEGPPRLKEAAMAKEICISTTPHETRLAILEDDQLAEIYYERENEYTLAGSIYKGRVTRVLPGMQSSFVDVGLERDAFLYVTDFLEEQEDSEDYVSESNRRPRHEQPAAEEAEAERNAGERGQDRSGERGGQGRGDDRSGERGGQGRGDGRNGEGRGDRSQIRSQEERGRRGAGAADGDRGDRSARERSREQVVAPLREAVPAAQDLEEKGDTEESGDADSPAGDAPVAGPQGPTARRAWRAG